MTIKTLIERLRQYGDGLPAGLLLMQEAAKEIERLTAQLATECRHIKQAEGKHPAPCARFCEAKAYEIEMRQLKAEIDGLRAYNATRTDELMAAAKRIAELEQALDAWEKQEPVLEVVRMPDRWDGLDFRDGGGSYISEGAISRLPIGTKLYTKPKEAT